MNLFDTDTDNIIINIDGQDIEMKPAICYGKVYDKWYVSKCGKVWSIKYNRLLKGRIAYEFKKEGKRIRGKILTISTPLGFWEDGSGNTCAKVNTEERKIVYHKVIMDTWKPLYDNPPVGVSWETWVNVRDYPDNLKFYSESVAIDHIDNDTTNNHIDNLRRVTQWDNNPHIKKRLK